MTDLKLPTRPAPAPPRGIWQKQSDPFLKPTTNNRGPFLESCKLSRSQSAGKLGEAKKPPPRPPPPAKLLGGAKLSTSSSRKQPSQLLTGLFTRNKSGANVPKSQTCTNLSEQSAAKRPTAPCGLLIDLNSPPSSPTLTTHSSSDGFSVNSFGSDGVFNGLNSGSQMESGFEDDFDLLMVSGKTTPSAPDWSDDPFANPKQTTPMNYAPFELSNEDPRCRHKDPSVPVSTSVKPTIIRPKSSKPARPPPPKIRPASTPPTFVSLPRESPPDDWSPPMPSCPPPPPPPEVLTVLEHGPSLPPRPTTLIHETTEKKKPYCIAMYDYEAGHPDDLSFKVNDVIHLTQRVNNDWLRGTLNGKEGMFPASFTNIIVPLEQEDPLKFKHVVALYTFRPETWDDLPFQEGDTVKVTRRINDHWLYGECNGRQGQFPENYVSDVSALFPLQEVYS